MVHSVLRLRLEQLLREMWGQPSLVSDGDGDYPFRHRTAACYVRLLPCHGLVRVFAVAARCVPFSADLLVELNEVNEHALTVHAFTVDGQVVVAQTLALDGCGVESLTSACDAVGTVAHDVGTMISAVLGGVTPFSDAPPPEAAECDG